MERNHYILTNGRISRSEDTIRLDKSSEEEPEFIPAESIDSLYVDAQVDFNTRTVDFFNKKNIAVHIFNWSGKYVGSLLPSKKHISGDTIIKQVESYQNKEKRKNIAKKIVKASIHNAKSNLRYYENSGKISEKYVKTLEELESKVNEQDTIEELMGKEAEAKKLYYSQFPKITGEKLRMRKRSYNPPNNPENALISYLNSLVYTTCTTQIRKTALDPTVSYLHEPNERRFSLSLDIADVFKPNNS